MVKQVLVGGLVVVAVLGPVGEKVHVECAGFVAVEVRRATAYATDGSVDPYLPPAGPVIVGTP